jgi:hypothetical protein
MCEVLPQTITRRIVIAEGVSPHTEQRHLVLAHVLRVGRELFEEDAQLSSVCNPYGFPFGAPGPIPSQVD